MGKWKRAKSLRKRWDRNFLINKYGAVCYLCDKTFKSMKDITIDHYTPLSKGGESSTENYRLAHYHCNRAKSDMTPEEWEELQGR